MKPFSIANEFLQLKDTYPRPEELARIARTANFYEQECLMRLWLSEGIPFAFRDFPGLYEVVRGWLGSRLSVHPKTITLIGSARIGYSLAPHPAFGRTFSAKSDLDFAVVSEPLFLNLSAAFAKWKYDASTGNVRPTNNVFV